MIEKIVRTWLGNRLLRANARVLGNRVYIKLWNYGCTYFKDAPLIMFQKSFVGDYWLWISLTKNTVKSKQFSVFCYFFLLNCYVINSGWSLWIVSPAMQNFAKFCFSLLFIIFIHCIIHLLTDIYYLFTDNGHFVVLNEKITFFVFNLVLNYQLFFDLINPNPV